MSFSRLILEQPNISGQACVSSFDSDNWNVTARSSEICSFGLWRRLFLMAEDEQHCECLLLSQRIVLLEENVHWRCCAVDSRYGVSSQCTSLSQYVFCWDRIQKPFCRGHASFYLQHRTCLFCGTFCTQCSEEPSASRFVICMKMPEVHWTHHCCKLENGDQCSHCGTTEHKYFQFQSVEELDEFAFFQKMLDSPLNKSVRHVNLLSLCGKTERSQIAAELQSIKANSFANQLHLNSDGFTYKNNLYILNNILVLTLGEEEFLSRLQNTFEQILKKGYFAALLVLLQCPRLPLNNWYLESAVKVNQSKFAKVLFNYKENDKNDLELLFHALSHRNWGVALLFLQYGFREKLGGICLLHEALSKLTVEAVFFLANHGLSLYEVDKAGQSILHVLAKMKVKSYENFVRRIFDKLPFASYLLDLRDSSRCSALDYAFQKKNWLIVECLLMKGVSLPDKSFLKRLPNYLFWLPDYYEKECEPKKRLYLPRAFIDRDISKGKECVAISAENSLFDNAELTTEFTYLSAITHVSFFSQKCDFSLACNCSPNCDQNCPCLWRRTYNDQGLLVDDMISAAEDGTLGTLVECNANCSCSSDCISKVAQKGIRIGFEVYRSSKYGWAVRTSERIPKGQFVSEYAGKVITGPESNKCADDSYFFEINDGIESCCIDAKFFGNVSRFLNHSCESNLVVLHVVWDVYTQHIPHICFYAKRDIAKGEELTFDYGNQWWNVKSRLFVCKCGSKLCRYKEKRKEKSREK